MTSEILRKLQILVVDDDPDLCEVVERYLTEKGYDTTSVHRGVDAVACLETVAYDLILLDINLPRLSGPQVLDYLQGLKNPPPVLMMSGMAEKKLQEDVVRRGTLAFLAKPFTPERLLAAVERVLSRAKK
ncbi:MAG: response regulator [bacterium]